MIATATTSAMPGLGQNTSRKQAPSVRNGLTSRRPTPADAAHVTDLVRRAGTLESNTAYAYVLLCSHFSGTSAIAERDGTLVGCLLGYRIPERPQTLFLWQIGVDESERRRGVARHLLDELLHRHALSDVAYIETTVGRSNLASRGLFEQWAKQHEFELRAVGVFESSLFGPPASHEPEDILRIGPLLEKK